MPAGYYVGTVAFDAETGEPVDAATSNTSFVPVLSNVNNSRCPGNCFRPVGMAFDKQGRMFMASDASGEIYVIMQEKGAVGRGMLLPRQEQERAPVALQQQLRQLRHLRPSLARTGQLWRGWLSLLCSCVRPL